MLKRVTVMDITYFHKRRKEVLQAVVETYIETVVPVSSEAVTRKIRSKISPATIRNIMAELDHEGLVFQPHTSAGRVPTDKGYRYYIDSLLEVEQLTPEDKELIQERYALQNEVFDELLPQTLTILASCSGYTAVAFSSGLKKILFKRLEFVPMPGQKFLVVLVSNEGIVKTALVQMPGDVEQSQLPRIANFLNEEFAGLSFEAIQQRISLQCLSPVDSFFPLIRMAKQILELTLASFDRERLYFSGTSYILEQPEFQDAQRLQGVLRSLEKQGPLLLIMKDALDYDGVKVHIGRETACADFRECSLVISNFKSRNKTVGTLGIIGPRRMFYSRVISTVKYIAQSLGERIADSYS
ncbi:MAG: heat-inducible transcriptional repressor HrcA [Candidatus Omnitrophota bacterium]